MSKTQKPKVFIIVLNYNGAKTLPNCLASVFRSDYSNFEVIVVDNNSTDESFEKARLQYSRAHFIKNSTNVGFARGNNIGIRYALEKFADFIFILNNDAIIKNDTLSILTNSFQQNSGAGIISPLIFAEDNKTIWFAGGKIDWLKMKTRHVFSVVSPGPYPSEYITGCAMMIGKEVFKKIGLFDERYFLYYEDADFSLRAKRAGFELVIDPSAQIAHLEQSNHTNHKKLYWLVLSGLLFFKTNASFLQKIWLAFYVPMRKLKNLYDMQTNPSQNSRDVQRAYLNYKKIILK